jgi:hypothetical protein
VTFLLCTTASRNLAPTYPDIRTLLRLAPKTLPIDDVPLAYLIERQPAEGEELDEFSFSYIPSITYRVLLLYPFVSKL